MTWRERWAELKRIYGGDRHREVRHTAVGWNPGEWIEDPQPTPSGTHEYYTVVRAGKKQPEPAAQRVPSTKRVEVGVSDD